MIFSAKNALIGLLIAVFYITGCTSELTQENLGPQDVDRADTRQGDGSTDTADTHTPPDSGQDSSDISGDDVIDQDAADADTIEEEPVGTLTFTLKNRSARSLYTYPSPAGTACAPELGWLNLTVDDQLISPDYDCTQCECGTPDCDTCDLSCPSGATQLPAGETREFVWHKNIWDFDQANACLNRTRAVGDTVVAKFCWGYKLNDAQSEPITDHRCKSKTVTVTNTDQTVEFVVDSGQLDWQTGDTFKSANNWLEARVGDMPLVISAPHGGGLKPNSISDRTCNSPTTSTDMRTAELADEFARRLQSQYGQRPSLVLAHLQRAKIDLNRDIDDATCGNATMEEVWHQYHEYVEAALARAIDTFGYVIYIDLHGHGHTKQRLELGYAHTKASLKKSHQSASEAARLGKNSSLGNLIRMSDLTFQELLTGDQAFGTLVHTAGIPAVPSRQDPFPLDGDKYFSGGYNIRRYTDHNYSKVFGWQIETHKNARWGGSDGGAAGRKKFARAFADAIMDYIDHVEAHMNE